MESLEQKEKMQILYIMNASTWGREGLKPTFDMSGRGQQRGKALKSPFTLRFKDNTTDIGFLLHLGRFICNKKKRVIFYGEDFSFRLHTNLNWFPLLPAFISRKSIQFQGLWPLEYPLDEVPEWGPGTQSLREWRVDSVVQGKANEG